MPRHTVLTPTLQDAICELVRAGSYPGPAGESCGVDGSTATRWLVAGERDEMAGVDSPYRNFRTAVKQAEAEAEQAMIAVVRDAATRKKDWIAAMTYLERRYRERWGRPAPIQIQQDIHNETQITQVEIVLSGSQGIAVSQAHDTVKQLPAGDTLDTVNTPE